MIKHIVIWQLKDVAEGADRETNASLIKQKLEALRGRIPGLSAIEVGIDISRSDSSGDVVLYSEFDDALALECYQKHPEHLAIKDFIRSVTQQRKVADYETA